VQGFVTYSWYGLSAPRGTPPAIVATLNRHLNDILSQPAIEKRLTDLGLELRPVSSAEFMRFVAAEIKKFQDVARRAKIAVD
jgi:tripartite-type tricarboxylate transporter receptor subunit TctC